jgi:hypothetical protein
MRTKKSKGSIATAKAARDWAFPGVRVKSKRKQNKPKKNPPRQKKSKGGFIKNSMPKAKPN